MWVTPVRETEAVILCHLWKERNEDSTGPGESEAEGAETRVFMGRPRVHHGWTLSRAGTLRTGLPRVRAGHPAAGGEGTDAHDFLLTCGPTAG